MHLSMFRSWIRIELVRKTLMRRMTFAGETAVVVLVRYERVHVTVRTRNRLAAFPLTGPPQIRKICAVFFISLSLFHTHPFYPSSPVMPYTVCRGRQVDAIEERSPAGVYEKKNNNTRKKMPASFVR
ncbi:unnamed protein product [Aphis gossypii]|uniref:Uncharacterized protein n=1 Tax=Aphis gossypii TaxID=80765 RepID=A0A9P0IV35_APHGO|nr:unnamed protein product [Aphis gossypii]